MLDGIIHQLTFMGNVYDSSHHIKRLTAGLNQFNRPEIFKAIQDLKTSKVPFVNLPEKKSQHQHAVIEEVMAECVWVRPEQPVEIEFVNGLHTVD
jgi:hypothetical protein